VSSLGHSILIPALVGGTWAQDLDVSAPESPYLAFVVGLHVATALALLVYFRRDWMRIIRGLVTSIARREVTDADQRLAWLLVLATIPVGVSGLLLEHVFRVYLSKPVPTAAFLALNGVVLLLGEHLRRRADAREQAPAPTAGAAPVVTETAVEAGRRLAKLGDLAGPLGDGIRPQVLVGSMLSGLSAYISVAS
jgi:undecaprenyl-diphosphatase